MTIDGHFIKFTGIAVYLEDKAVASLAPKWKGKSSEELVEDLHFFRDIISGKVTLPFTGGGSNFHGVDAYMMTLSEF